MRAYVHYWRHVTGHFGRLFGPTLRLKTGRLHPGRGSELYVSFPCFMAFIESLSVKYIALLAMAKIVPSHPHLVAEYQDTILASVNDPDISIRMRALDLVTAMVSSGI